MNTLILKNFIMSGTDDNGNEFKLVMNDEETAMYISSGYGEWMDTALDAWAMAYERTGIVCSDMVSVQTEEETA